eukprot:13495021-Alexandrium_andersonii.AAC.1
MESHVRCGGDRRRGRATARSGIWQSVSLFPLLPTGPWSKSWCRPLQGASPREATAPPDSPDGRLRCGRGDSPG